MSKRWVNIFKALGNINRIKIIQMLAGGQSLSVTDIAGKIHVSIKSTSRHLMILRNLELLDTEGKSGHVFYSLNKAIPRDIEKAIHLFTNSCELVNKK
jgi:ArsR family transcriptional regulator